VKRMEVPIERVSLVRQALVARAREFELESTYPNVTPLQLKSYEDAALYLQSLADALARAPGISSGRPKRKTGSAASSALMRS
jgi:hypothetical protein